MDKFVKIKKTKKESDNEKIANTNNTDNIINKETIIKTKNENSNGKDISKYLPDRILRDFYTIDGVELAKNLLGKIIVRNLDNGSVILAKIVETEAYMGKDDKACHAYNNKKTDRTKYFWENGGHLYIYNIYMPNNFCVNIVSGISGVAEAVLIRAVEPISGIDEIQKIRNKTGTLSKGKLIELTNGPAKCGMSLNIDKSFNAVDLVNSDKVFLINDPTNSKFDIEITKRINIDYAQEYKDKLWRFIIKGNPFVSKVKN